MKALAFILALMGLVAVLQVVSPHSAYNQRGGAAHTSVQ